MPGLDSLFLLLPTGDGLWAYGPAPGVELIPYFLSLVAWVAMVFFAILLAPFAALLRRFRKNKNTPAPAEPKHEAPTEKTVE